MHSSGSSTLKMPPKLQFSYLKKWKRYISWRTKKTGGERSRSNCKQALEAEQGWRLSKLPSHSRGCDRNHQGREQGASLPARPRTLGCRDSKWHSKWQRSTGLKTRGRLEACGRNNWTPRYFTPPQVADSHSSRQENRFILWTDWSERLQTSRQHPENRDKVRAYRLNGAPTPSFLPCCQEAGRQEKEKHAGS